MVNAKYFTLPVIPKEKENSCFTINSFVTFYNQTALKTRVKLGSFFTFCYDVLTFISIKNFDTTV